MRLDGKVERKGGRTRGDEQQRENRLGPPPENTSLSFYQPQNCYNVKIRGQGDMEFTITWQRALLGNDVDVRIKAEAEEIIVGVTCSLDNVLIGSDELSDAPSLFFQRSFIQVGEARPGLPHRLIVEVRGKDGEPSRFATSVWTDQR
jgi:hypothetical protein